MRSTLRHRSARGAILLLVASGALGGGCAPRSVPLPSPVDPMLVTAASTAQHRLLVFRACEDGRCSSDAYLQWFRDYPPEVAHTAPVPELGEGRVVTSARWVRHRARPALVAVLDPREKDGEPQTVYLIPGQPGRYEIER